MIRSFEIRDPATTHIEWMPKVPALAQPRKFEFKPGLNILWGKNGSGKSTVLKALARLLMCEQGGTPVVTHHAVMELFPYRNRRLDADPTLLQKSVALDHDGQAVRFFDPSSAVGLMGGGSAFDDDFFTMGVANTVFKGSAGETTMFRFDKMVREIIEGKVPKIERKMTADRVNDTWAVQLKIIDSFLEGSGEKGQPTILLDEPERSYDLPHQLGIWRFIRALSSRVQFIVASHSFFGLRLPEAHYIEMEEGYLTTSLLCFAKLNSTWAAEKPEAAEYEGKLAKKDEKPKMVSRKGPAAP